jgi:hypothetical protein
MAARPEVGKAARVEVSQERKAKGRDEADMPGEVVERMIRETDLEASGLRSSPEPWS